MKIIIVDLTFSSDNSSDMIFNPSESRTSTCFGTNHRYFSHCFPNERYEKKYKFWLNLLQAEEWNYFLFIKR